MNRTAAIALALALGLLAAGRGARAYDPATTHAGLTQQAALASTLHLVLARRLARPLGLFESVALHPETMPLPARRLLLARLGALDPAGGYRPGADWAAPALAWTTAGSVIAKTPPERVQNLFYDPSTGAGLRDDAALEGFVHGVRLAIDGGGSLRGVATGTSFALEGAPALSWLESPENDVGLLAFHDQLEAAVTGGDAAARSSALARALLAMGGVLAVLEDLGNPAQVRNDFRGAYLRGRTGSPFDRSSPYERYVAEVYGIAGVPGVRSVVRRPTVRAFFTATDGQGLADRTQRRFFSGGTLPEDAVVDRDTTTRDVVQAAQASLRYALPALPPRLELAQLGRPRYVTTVEEDGKRRRLLGYERVAGRVRFFLDGAVHADTARALLPEIAGYGAGLIDHLLRAEVRLEVDGGALRATVVDPSGRIEGGTLRLLAEDAAGRRREIASFAADKSAGGALSVAIPADARRVAGVLRGTDAAGPVVALGELALPARR